MKNYSVQSLMQMVSPPAMVQRVEDKSDLALLATQSCQRQGSGHTRTSIRPQAILEVVRRRGRSWGLLAQYEEGRLGIKR